MKFLLNSGPFRASGFRQDFGGADSLRVLLSLLLLAATLILTPWVAAAPDDAAALPLTITIDGGSPRQRIDNFGSSAGWAAGNLARTLPAEKLDALASLVFSLKTDPAGTPLGIGLTAFRIQIGAGTWSQARHGGIREAWRSSDCCLQPDGTYDWSKNAGEQWWLRKAHEFKVPTLIAYSLSPPVQFTANGFGYKTKESMEGNLRPEHYKDFVDFLATVIEHFERAGTPFSYISPVNEPQWPWSFPAGQAKQEGSPWTNAEISRLVVMLSKEFQFRRIRAQILTPEAATLNFLTERKKGFAEAASDQIRAFWESGSQFRLGSLSNVAPIVAGHGYFLDHSNEELEASCSRVATRIREIDPALRFWQTEYSMIGGGVLEGRNEGDLHEMDSALFIAKVIHYDMTAANASAWQFWETFAAENSAFPRFLLVAANDHGHISATKNLWALGHFSRFVRPGMIRLEVARSDGLSSSACGNDVMASSYTDPKTGTIVTVLINYSAVRRAVAFRLKNFPFLQMAGLRFLDCYLTTAEADVNLRHLPEMAANMPVLLPPRSIVTAVMSSTPLDHSGGGAPLSGLK